MIRLAPLIILLLLLAAPAEAAQSCAASKREGSKVLERSSEAVVFARGRKVYGCLRSRDVNRRLPLGEVENALRVEAEEPIALAGRYVAYSVIDDWDPYEDPTSHLIVFDLARAEIVLDTPGDNVADIALKRNASVAWIASWCVDCRYMGGGGTRVRRWEGRRVELLDSYSYGGGGATIDLKSLELAGDRRSVTWQTGAGERSARLR
ncbi:MAG TPA: hypothetical protein VF715_05385 [Thermoleophilaceae bacterium]